MNFTKHAILLNKDDANTLVNRLSAVSHDIFTLQSAYINQDHPEFEQSLGKSVTEAKRIRDIKNILATEAGNICNQKRCK